MSMASPAPLPEPLPHDAVLHVGVGKTATTTLQNAVFAESPAVHCIGRPNHLNAAYERAFHQLTRAEPYEVDWPYLEDFFAEALATARETGRMVVLSDETLMASAPYQQVLAERLKRACPNAGIVLTIRSQPEIVVSYYKNHGRRVKAAPRAIEGRLIPFDDWLDFALARPEDTFLRLLRYDRVSRAYEAVFGREKVHILCYETLTASPRDYGRRWGALLGCAGEEVSELLAGRQENPGVTDRRLAYDRLRETPLGRAAAALAPFRGLLGPIKERIVSGGGAARIEMTADQRQALRGLFAGENAAVAARHRLDLGALGYPMPDRGGR